MEMRFGDRQKHKKKWEQSCTDHMWSLSLNLFSRAQEMKMLLCCCCTCWNAAVCLSWTQCCKARLCLLLLVLSSCDTGTGDLQLGGRISYLFPIDNRTIPLLSAKMGLCKAMTACGLANISMSPSVHYLLEYSSFKQELPVFPGLAQGCYINAVLKYVPLKAAPPRCVPVHIHSLWKQQITGLLLAPGCDLGWAQLWDWCQSKWEAMSVAALWSFDGVPRLRVCWCCRDLMSWAMPAVSLQLYVYFAYRYWTHSLCIPKVSWKDVTLCWRLCLKNDILAWRAL